ncbi:hypothetical protein ALC60_09011, partial [Trachymyrmex zeteki]
LRERYDNHKQLVHNHVKALYNIQPIAKESSAKLLSIVDEVTKHLRALKILNEPTEHWDSLVIYHIHTKLDRNTSNEWEKHKLTLKSQPSKLCDELGLKKTPANHYLDTLNCKGSIIKHTCSVTLSSLRRDFEFQINCLVLDEIAQQMPAEHIELQHLKFPKHLPLADPSFHIPNRVDILIGGEWFWRLLCIGQIEINKQGLVLQKTKLGWIVGGPTFSQVPKSIKCNLSNVKLSRTIDTQLRKFWELEAIDDKVHTSQEETSCEQHFIQTHMRNINGRFIVSIPLKIDPKQLGESRSVAIRRLISLEKRFLKDKTFKANYCAFMREYEELGHMTNIQETSHYHPTFYMPHHGVPRPASASTKLRVVFDGSSRSDSGLSLNDCQYVGPVVQEELFSILIRFRQYPYVVCADLQKMYRQILVSPNDRPLQRILW